jgi:flagellar biosynthetic protein FliP
VSGSHELPTTPPSGLGAATGHGDKQRRHATLVFAAAAPAADLGKLLTDAQSQFSGKGLIQTVVLVTVLAIAPAILLLVTCFTRIVVVLGLLRQALATGSLPPNQVLFGLALLMTVVVMAPVYQAINRDAITPYLDGKLNAQQALVAAEKHAREFMIRQIEGGRNEKDVYLFLPKDQAAKKDLTWGDVPVGSLIPAFVISELKIAFTIGFGIYLPFLIIDMLVSSVLVSMGMLMLPPVLISLPFKLLLFVLADGWHRVVGTLMTSFG